MRVLVTGAKGQLGTAVMRALRARRIPCLGVDQQDFDLTDGAAVRACVRACQPGAIIHCAAYTAVDRAETETARCCQVNAMGTLNVVRAALETGAKLAYVSTDYVFDGRLGRPCQPGDAANPLNIYGLSKWQGEQAVRGMMQRFFIVRTGWLYSEGHGFVADILRLGAERDTLRVVSDQIGTPTYAPDLAATLCDLVQTGCYGVYHAAGSGSCSRYELACEALRVASIPSKVVPVDSAAFHTPALRPLDTRLDCSSLKEDAGLALLPDWRDSLRRCIHGA